MFIRSRPLNFTLLFKMDFWAKGLNRTFHAGVAPASGGVGDGGAGAAELSPSEVI